MVLGALQVNDTLGFIVAFAGGLISFVSPCVLPLVPGYVSMISGLSANEVKQSENRSQLLTSSLLFIAGFTLVFVLLGATASTIGNFLNDHEIGLGKISGLFVIFMGLVLGGWVPIQKVLNNKKIYVEPNSLGKWTAPLMGMAFAFAWTPCIGAILAPILVLAADQDTVIKGSWLLLWYSLGLGIPFLLTALLMEKVSGSLGWFKKHSLAISRISAVVLIAFGILLFTGDLNRIATELTDVLPTLG